MTDKKSIFITIFGNFWEPSKSVYKVLFFATEPSVHTKIVKKVTKKVLT